MGRYAAFLTQPGTRWLALWGLVGRLPNGMLSLAFVLATVRSTGSYVAAGVAAATYTVGAAVGNPVWSRGVDRLGPRRVLTVTGIAQGVLLVTAGLLTSGRTSVPVLIVLAALSGALLPPLSAIMRSLWSHLFSGADAKDVKEAAFAYESVVVDLTFIVGPSIVAGLTAVADPSLALLVAAAATVVGCLCVAASPRTAARPRQEHGERHWLGPLRFGAVLGLLPVGFLLMGSITVIEIALVAFASQHGIPGTAGLLIAVLSVGGVLGGLYWGARKQPGTTPQQLMVLLVALAVGWALLALTGNPWLLAALLVVAGLALNPAITAQFSTMDGVAPEHTMTESFGWLNALASAGSAAGAAVTGALVRHQASPGFLLASGMCVAAFLVAVAMQKAWRSGQLTPAVEKAEQ